PIYVEVRRALTTELDYEQEASFTRIIHDNFEGRDCAVIPAVVDALTTKNVICTTWFEGKKITSPAILEHPGLDRTRLLERVLSTWIQMMYVDGVFQSDPHPGNLLVRIERSKKSEETQVGSGPHAQQGGGGARRDLLPMGGGSGDRPSREDGEPIFCVVDFGQVKILPRAFHQKL